MPSMLLTTADEVIEKTIADVAVGHDTRDVLAAINVLSALSG